MAQQFSPSLACSQPKFKHFGGANLKDKQMLQGDFLVFLWARQTCPHKARPWLLAYSSDLSHVAH